MIPEKVHVGPLEYEILRGPASDAYLSRCGRMGESDHLECVVRIRTDLTEQQSWETFWHEITHCVDYVYLNGKMDEDQVACFARGLMQVIHQVWTGGETKKT